MRDHPEIWQLPLAVVLVVLCSIYQAWIGSIVWGWFLVPLGLPPINTAQAFGILCLVSIPVLGTSKIEEPAALAVTHLVSPALILAVAYVARGFV